MKRLTLLRHAKAAPATDTDSDRERPLAERGERDAPLMGQRLKQAGARPSLILTSPALRTMQTANAVAHELGYPREFIQREKELYLASAAEILRVLARQDNAFNDILLCGHNPGLTDLINQLTRARIDDLPTCGVVVMETTAGEWQQLAEGAELRSFDYPKAEHPGE